MISITVTEELMFTFIIIAVINNDWNLYMIIRVKLIRTGYDDYNDDNEADHDSNINNNDKW